MARSRRKYKYYAGSNSEKNCKRIANRRFRKKVKQNIHHGIDMPLYREVSNVWDMNKDGKYYWHDMPAKYFRK